MKPTDERTAVLNEYLIKSIEEYLVNRFTENPPEIDRFHIGMPTNITTTLNRDPVNSFKDELTVTFKIVCRMK